MRIEGVVAAVVAVATEAAAAVAVATEEEAAAVIAAVVATKVVAIDTERPHLRGIEFSVSSIEFQRSFVGSSVI